MRCLKILAALALAGIAGGAAFVWSGIYDISATDQHLAPTYWLLETAMHRSVKQRAGDIEVPELGSEAQVQKGLALYRAHCVQCHGAPGVAPQPFALGLTPAPAALVHSAREWPPAQLYWVVREGIKMSGMPAWKYQMSDEEIWAVVAFLPAMAHMTPAQYRAMKSIPVFREEIPRGEKPDPARGRRAVGQHLCVTCHVIPGIVGPNAPVGPPLAGIGTRAIIAGVLPNTRENLVRWLRDPQAVDPDTAMPDLGLTERDARDIAAYLSTLE